MKLLELFPKNLRSDLIAEILETANDAEKQTLREALGDPEIAAHIEIAKQHAMWRNDPDQAGSYGLNPVPGIKLD